MKLFVLATLCATALNLTGQNETMMELLQYHLNNSHDAPVYSIIVGYETVGADDQFRSVAVGHRDKGGNRVTASDQFRIASVTKTFTAVIIMQLVEEGKLDIADPFLQYMPLLNDLSLDSLHILNGTNYSSSITIQQLLSHRTGLPDIYIDTGDKFFEQLFNDPKRQFTPHDVLTILFDYGLNTKAHFAPGTSWKYSDLNYVLLGLIIEKLDNTTYAESLRRRILDPLDMKNTYLEFHEPVHGEAALLDQYYGAVNMTKINTSFDWAGGGLVSTLNDLDLFLKGLFSHELVSEHSLGQMTDAQFTGPNSNKYGYGIFETVWHGVSYYGHYGFYGTYAGFAPETGRVFIYNISQAKPPFDPHDLMGQVLLALE